tara:strand:- start:2094 stop:2831 length:738 start_codon:yes stop_codon:yes gene_type:complete
MKELKIFGLRPVIEAIESKRPIDKVWIVKSSNSKLHADLTSKLRKNNIPFSLVPKQALERKLRGKNHQGVFARISPIEIITIDKMIQNELKKEVDPIYLLLDGVTDPRNFGAILRSANATSVNGVIICSSSSAPINEDVLKASSGAIFNVPISKVNNLKDAIYLLKENNIEIMGLEQKAKKLIYDINLKKPLAILIGSEEKGISKGILKMVNQKTKIPMTGTVESLNVSVAVSIALFEVLRQRNV